MTSLMIRRARVVGDGRLIDVSILDGRIAAVGRALDATQAPEVDLDGRWILPGLWDAHVHFTQWARHLGRVDLRGVASAADAAATLLAHAGSRAAGDSGPVVGRGFQDALWPDALTAELLEAGPVPVLAVSHDLHCVWLNEPAARLLGAPHAGVLREDEAFAAEVALDRLSGDPESLVTAAVAAAAARGVVGIRDLEFADNVASWQERVANGLAALHVEACIYPEHVAAHDRRGLRGGAIVPGTEGLVSVGGLKLFADGSLNTRTALTHEAYGPDASVGHAAHSPGELRKLLRDAKRRGLEVALHAIGDLAVTRALDAFEATGAAGTIEHAQLVRGGDLARFARLGVTASVQPQHALDDRDVADAVWADRAQRAFAYRSLHEAGAHLVLGSDAPVAPLDPWVTIAAAATRTDDERASWHPEQELPREVAIAASVRSAIVPGQVGDVVAVDLDPLTTTPAALRAMPVALTVVGGNVTYSSS